jgi:hypothetical protein
MFLDIYIKVAPTFSTGRASRDRAAVSRDWLALAAADGRQRHVQRGWLPEDRARQHTQTSSRTSTVR